MAKLLEEIELQALQLPPEDREMLAGALLHSLEEAPPSEIDEAWIAEAERRYQDWRAGKTELLSGKQFPDSDGPIVFELLHEDPQPSVIRDGN